MTLAECFHVADDIVKLGCEELTFIGGEVFLYAEWEKLARHFSDRGVLVNIMTNAYRIGEKEIGQIRYANLSNVGISLDGMEKNHNRVRGKRDAFAHIGETFDLLNEAGIPIGIITSLMEMNYPDLEPLYRYLLDNNVRIWQLQLVNPMGNMADKRNLIIRPGRIPRLTEFVREKNKDRRMSVVAADSIGYYDENEPYIRGQRNPLCLWGGCQAGITGIGLDSVGNVKGCGALYDDAFIEGNVRERSLIDIWNDPNCFVYNRAFDPLLLSGSCQGCDVGDACKGGCRASNYFTADSLYANAFCQRSKQIRLSRASPRIEQNYYKVRQVNS
jgi:radical SAM protein with 4Fe4S-binding SPASM domain